MAITGKSKTEALYRANMLDSSSSLKDFSVDRKKYHKKYILGEAVEDKDNQFATMGRIVETLLLEPEEFDNRFFLSSTYSVPTGLMLLFVEALYKLARNATDESGIVQKNFIDLTKEAYSESGYKIPYETVINKFVGSDAEIYYREICSVRDKNLTVISANEVSFAERIVITLKNNTVTKDIINLVDSARYTVLNQLQIEGYEVEEHLFKSMIDKVIIDHQEQKISIYDLKCTWSVENFYEEYYLYRRAYIQGYLYYFAVKSLVEKGELFKEFDLSGYTVELPQFIVCDSGNYHNPLIYKMTEKNFLEAKEGFVYKGKTYPGAVDLITDLKWALEKNVWNISRKNYLSKGIVKMNEI